MNGTSLDVTLAIDWMRSAALACSVASFSSCVGSFFFFRSSCLSFSAATNTCAMGNVLSKLPYNRSDSCDIDGVLTELRKAA